MEDPLKPPPAVLPPPPLRLRPPFQGLQVLQADRSVPLLPVSILFEVYPLESQGLAPLPGLAAND